MLQDQEQAVSAELAPPVLLFPAVFVGTVRATAVTCAAGYALGQVLHDRSGPPLVGGVTGWGGFIVTAAVAVLIWLEVALLQTWPRVGLALSALWSAAAVIVGGYAAFAGNLAWLIPTAGLALPSVVSLARPSAWRLPSRPWVRPSVPRLLETSLMHALGGVGVAVVWTGPMATAPAAGGVLLGAVLLVWLLAAVGLVSAWMRRDEPAERGLLVTTQVGVFIAVAVFVGAAAV